MLKLLPSLLALCVSRSLMTHASIPAEDREKLGISDSLVSVSNVFHTMNVCSDGSAQARPNNK